MAGSSLPTSHHKKIPLKKKKVYSFIFQPVRKLMLASCIFDYLIPCNILEWYSKITSNGNPILFI